MTAKVESSARRVPTQDRSRQRVERILDAAAEVFADVGVEAATTESIAAKAGTSIGSLYQFFPNKKALFYAIVARYTERVRAVFDAIIAPTDRSWIELLDFGIDALDEFHRQDPGFRAILRNWSSGEFLEADDAINTEFARRIEGLLAVQAPALTPAHRAVVAEIVVETTSAMLILAARRDEPHGALVIAEGKTMLHRYLEPYAALPRGKRRGAGRSGKR
jgi:AcrR family transcriptional regulator